MAETNAKISLKSRMIVGFTLTFGLTMILSISFVLFNFQSMIVNTVRIGAVNLTAGLVDNIRKQLSLTEDISSLQRFSLDISRVVESASMVDYIRILSNDLHIIASQNLAESGTKLDQSKSVLEKIGASRTNIQVINQDGQTHVVIPVEIADQDNMVYVLVSYEEEFLNASRWMMVTQSFLVAIVALIIAAVISYLLFKNYIEKPLVEISDAFQRVRKGDLDTQVPDFDTEEFSETSRSISELFNIIR